jgi:hypothetical protein
MTPPNENTNVENLSDLTAATAIPPPHEPPVYIPYPDRVADPDPEFDPANQKRNSGRTGPTSPAGRAASSQNARKHGACSATLILPGESENDWLSLLSRWQAVYRADPDSLAYDFVVKTAQAEWFRIRVQLQYDDFVVSVSDTPACWASDQIKKHDLMLRYKTTAERSFQREFRLLEQFCKIHKPTAPEENENNEAEPTTPPAAETIPEVRIKNSATGQSVIIPSKPAVRPLWNPPSKDRASP